MKILALLIICFLPQFLFSQAKYLIYFTDKSSNGYSTDHPELFLSSKSIERRIKQNITIKEADLPINQKYTDSLKKLGLTVWYSSKWFNAAYVSTNDTSFINNTIKSLSFVKRVQMLIPLIDAGVLRSSKVKKDNNLRYFLEEDDYGESLNQVSQLCADEMHKEGFHGEGMTVAIFDGGFSNANNVYFLDSLFYQGRMLGTYNFVKKNTLVYDYSSHGTNVLSCMSGYAKGKLIGTAYKAQYYLFITEDGASEYPVEEANWLIAAERADSLGVDVINSSLGYSTFDDSRFNNNYKDRDGRKPISSLAATMAARVGMLCVVSAGNGGTSRFDPYVSSPGDADSILTVGAIDKNGMLADFSSYGPTIDGRIKPEVVAKGVSSTLGNPNGSIGTGNGTSFSSPIMAGMVTGLWQSLPNYTNMQIIDLLKKSSSLYDKPSNKYGYGIPCFFKARLLDIGKSNVVLNDQYVFPNPFSNENLLLVLNQNDTGRQYTVEFFDGSARNIYKQKIDNAQASNQLGISSNSLLPGLYFIRIATANSSKVIRLVKI